MRMSQIGLREGRVKIGSDRLGKLEGKEGQAYRERWGRSYGRFG